MLDAITLEKRGIPAASIGVDILVNSVGLAMRKLHGMPDYPVATYPEARTLEQLQNEDELSRIVKITAPQVEAILIKK